MDVPAELIEYSTATLECLAREVFRRRPRSATEPPVDLEFLIENEEGLTLSIKDGLHHRHNVEGCVIKEGDLPGEEPSQDLHVWVDYHIYSSNWARYNAVLSEEFAHIQLHLALVLKVKTVEDFVALQQHPEWDRFERDAKKFSRMLRMPVDSFVSKAEDLYSRLVDEHGFSDPILVCKFLRNELASKFESEPLDAQRRMLDPSCNIERRILASVQSGERVLLPEHYVLSAKSERQPELFERSRFLAEGR